MDSFIAKRNAKEHFTRMTLPDGTNKDFKTIRGAIVFPFKKAPGVILVGGLGKETATVKILVEREFKTLGVAASELFELQGSLLIYRFYYQDIPETEAPVGYLLRKANLIGRLQPALHSENFEYGVLLIDEYLGTNRLSVSQNGLLESQFTSNWEGVNIENPPQAVIALSCLLAALEADPPDKGLMSEFNMESCFSP
jgi:hypothetical protein